jgi:hypothetical protein
MFISLVFFCTAGENVLQFVTGKDDSGIYKWLKKFKKKKKTV